MRRLDLFFFFLIISFKHVLGDFLPLALLCDCDAWPGSPSLGANVELELPKVNG